MTHTLYPYQQEGAMFLAGRRFAYLADEMGLGKTPQAIRAAVSLQANEAFSTRVLIVTRGALRQQWASEWGVWSDAGAVPRPLFKLNEALPSYGPLIVSYDFARGNRARLKEWEPSLIILDEAQDVRGVDALRTKALFGKEGIARARSAPVVWWLSGTPIEYTPADLWMPLYFSGHFPDSRARFLERYCELKEAPDGSYRPIGAKEQNIPELRERLAASGFLLRRTKDEVGLQLPQLNVSTTQVTAEVPPECALIDKAQLSAEYKILAHAMGDLSELTLESLAEMQATAKSVSTLLRYNGLLKVTAATELAKLALESSRKLVVFFKHTNVGRALARRLEEFSPVVIEGGMTDHAVNLAKYRFNTHPDCRIIIGQLRTAGAGHNFQAADQAIVVETEWDSASLDQAIGRVHRIGSRFNTVTAQVLVLADDALDQTIARLIVRRRDDIRTVLA